MKFIGYPLSICISILFYAYAVVQADSFKSVPALTGRVVDEAGVLSLDAKNTLEGKLKSIEDEKGSQVAILIVQTTAPEVIEQYTLRVVEKWKLGRKGIDDGVLLALAIKDRATRLEVGYGLEGSLTDVRSKQIIDDLLRPYLREGKFGEGLGVAVDAIGKVIRGEELPPSTLESYSSHENPGSAEMPIFLLSFAGLFISNLLHRPLGEVKAGAVSSMIIFIAGAFLVSTIIGFIASAIVFVLSVINGGSNFNTGGGWRSGGGGGGWSSGGGGGFSGGGGSFGGGGASGRW